MEPDEETTVAAQDEAPAIDTSESPAPQGPQLGTPEEYPPQAPMPGAQQQQEDPGAGAPVEDDASGVNQAVEGNQRVDSIRNALSAPRRAVGNAASSIMALLSGAGADHPSSIEQAGRQVDPNGELSPADRNMRAVSKIYETEGAEAALKIAQANRVAYNAKTAFAEQALKGNAQRPADLNASLHAANEAQAHVLDGSNVVFSQHRGMITATVTAPGSKDQQHINLSPAQYAQFLDQGNDGQWDKVMDASAPATLQRIAASGPRATPQGGATSLSQIGAAPQQQAPQPAQQQAPQQPQQQQPQQQPQQAPQRPQPKRRPTEQEFLRAHPAPDSEAVKTGKPVEYGLDAFPELGPKAPFGGPSGKGAGNQPSIPGTHDEHGHWLGPSNRAQEGDYSPALEARSRRLFPSVNEERARQEWMAGQEQQATKNDIDATKAGHEWTVTSARLRKEGVENAAAIKAEAQAKTDQSRLLAAANKMMANQQDARMREAGRNMRNEIGNPNFLIQTDEQRKEIARKWGVDPATIGAPSVPTGQAQAPPTGQAQPAPTGQKKMFNGKLYTREEFEALRH